MTRTLAVTSLALFGMLFEQAPSAVASTTAKITLTSSDLAEQASNRVTVAGTNDASRSLFAYVESNPTSTSTCAATAYTQQYNRYYSTRISPGTYDTSDAIAAGSYSKTYNWTPAAADTYLTCAYVQANWSTTPYAKASKLITARRSTATATISPPTADPSEQKPVELSVCWGRWLSKSTLASASRPSCLRYGEEPRGAVGHPPVSRA